ncbi:MAG: insulinase family protein [Candidatus Sungbacteria bacterium]|uniref:Insulinase family protein n=1 Tax=Candidatus Sungiibacteriota bacterium TaxID=2750080 RepID=A0A932YVF4_9BACT|nr:insulinase family protein [Candidatus Sungbacteria bacterium]
MFKKITLSSGLRLITVPMGNVTTVTILALVDTGSNNETKEANGISHFLEHMFFKGTARRPAAKIISEEVDGLGGYTNAMTSNEYTGYYVKVPAAKFGQALDLTADIFLNSLLDQREVEKERGVIIQEIRMRHDDPQSHIGYLYTALLYGDQPAGWEIGGIPETIGRMNSEELRRYFQNQYTAEDTIVVVAGNFQEEQAVVDVTRAFGAVRHGKPRTRPAVVEVQKEPVVSLFTKQTDQTHLILGVRAFGAHDPRRFAASVLAYILGGSMASRMFEEVREKRGLAYAISTVYDDYTTYGSFETYAGVEHPNTAEAVRVILGEYRKIAAEAVPGAELARAKEAMKGRLALSLEGSDRLAFFVGGEEALTRQPLTVEEIYRKIDTVTAADIQRVAVDIFRDEHLNLALIGPHTEAGPFQEPLALR